MKKKLYVFGILVLLFSCRCLNSKYIHEDNVLYVWETIPNRESFYYGNKSGTAKLPKEYPFKHYKRANPFSCGLALVLDQNKEWKYIDKNGDVKIDASRYIMCWSFEEGFLPGAAGFKGLAYVCESDSDTWDYNGNGSRFGLINVKGDVVLPVEYDGFLGGLGFLFPYDNIWWVRKNDLWGAVNEKAKFIIPMKYTEITAFESGFSLVKLDSLWGLINKKGKTVFPFSITEYEQFATAKSLARTIAKQGDYWGMINEKGKTIVPFIYYRWEDFQEGNIRMYKEDGSYITWNVKEDKLEL